MAVRLARAVRRHLGDRGARRAAHQSDRARTGGARPEPAPPAHPGERDRHPRAARARPGRRSRSAPASPAAWPWATRRSRGRTRGATSSSCARCCAARRSRSTVRSCRCCTVPTSRRRFPIETPIVVAANGPKGMAVARELGDGVMTIGERRARVRLVLGARVRHRARRRRERRVRARARRPRVPALTVVYHAMYEGDPASVDALPDGVEWRKRARRDPGSRTPPRDPRGPPGARHRTRSSAARRRPAEGVHVDRRGRRGARADRRARRPRARPRFSTRRWAPTFPASCARSWRWRRLRRHEPVGGAGEARSVRRQHGRRRPTPDELIATVQAAEAAGFDSVWAGEHVVLPDPQAPPSPMAPQDPALDPLLALSWAAAHTTTHAARDRDRHPPAAQSGRAGEADREPRRAQRRPLHVRCRCRLPRTRVPRDRRRLRAPRRGHRRVPRRDATPLVRRAPGVPRPLRRLRRRRRVPAPGATADPDRVRRALAAARTGARSRAGTAGTASR